LTGVPMMLSDGSKNWTLRALAFSIAARGDVLFVRLGQ
jgi:hypothetical protein